METKNVIIKSTFKLLLTKGFDAVSITDIQSMAGISRGLLYHYFPNKEELFIQVTEKYFIKIFDFDIRKISDYTIPMFIDFLCKRFRKIAKTISEIASDTNNMPEVSLLNYHYLFYQVMQRDTIFRSRYKATIDKERIAWGYALKNSISKNEIRKDIDVTYSANQLYTLTDGIWFQSMFSNDDKSLVNNLEESLLHYIALLE